MDIIVSGDQNRDTMDRSGNFDGEVRLTPYFQSTHLRVNHVTFDAGARTHWHRHTGGQLLYAVSGRGWVGDIDSDYELTVGDVAVIGADELHWHGSKEEHFEHIAVTMGETIWHERVNYEDFAQSEQIEGGGY